MTSAVAEREADRLEELLPHWGADFNGPSVFHIAKRMAAKHRRCHADWSDTSVNTVQAVAPQIRAEFERRAREWKSETAICSQLDKIVLHPAYQRIMALGPQVISLILEDLSKMPAHWFWALHNLVPEGKDPADGTTSIREATDAWLQWGKEEGYI